MNARTTKKGLAALFCCRHEGASTHLLFADFVQRLVEDAELGADWVIENARHVVNAWNAARDVYPDLGLDSPGTVAEAKAMIDAKYPSVAAKKKDTA
jgi:hypothetical protein